MAQWYSGATVPCKHGTMARTSRKFVNTLAERNASDREDKKLREIWLGTVKRVYGEKELTKDPEWNVRGKISRVREGVGRIVSRCLRAYDDLAPWLLSCDTG